MILHYDTLLLQLQVVMRSSNFLVFIISVVVSCSALIIERLFGIGWDFHPDAVTYVNNAGLMTDAVLMDWVLVFNNLYYVIVDLLDSNVFLLITINILLFSFTNVMLWRFHKSLLSSDVGLSLNPMVRNSSICIFLLVLANPYRVHLSTALLKDTLVIFLMVALLLSRSFLSAVVLFALRKASVFYFIALLPMRYLLFVCLIAICAFVVDYDFFINHLEFMHNTDMQFRDFDRVPSFSEYGNVGILLRGIFWPFFAYTGLFAVTSPSFEMFLLALGSVFTLLYSAVFFGRSLLSTKLLAPFISMFLFALLVSGFTSYIRYVYPILTVMPIVACTNLQMRKSA